MVEVGDLDLTRDSSLLSLVSSGCEGWLTPGHLCSVASLGGTSAVHQDLLWWFLNSRCVSPAV